MEDQGVGESGDKVVGGGGEEEEVAGEGDGLDGKVAGDEGRVAEEEESEWRVGRRRRQRHPGGRNGIEGEESYTAAAAAVVG